MYGKLLTIGVCILSVLVGQGPAEAPLADRLPARTLLYIASAGDSQALSESHLGRFLRTPEMQRTIEQFKKGMIADAGGQVEMVSLMEMLHQGAKGKACFALVDLIDPEKPHDDEPTFAFIAQLGDNEKAFAKALDALMATAPAEIRKKKTIGRAKLYDIGSGDERVVLGIHEKTFYLIFGLKLPEQILGAAEMESLAGSARFKQQFGQVDGRNVQLAVYLQPDRLIQAALEANANAPQWMFDPRDTGDELAEYKKRKQTENRQIRAFLDGLGIGKATGLAGAARVTDDGLMHTKIKLFSPAPHNGLLMVADGEPVTEADLAAVPSDAIYAAVSNVPARRILLEAARIFRSLPEGQAPNLDAVVRRVEQATGINLVTDVFDQLGDVSTLTMTRGRGGLAASTVFSIELKDAAKVQTALDKVRKLLEDAPPPMNPRRHRRRPFAQPSIESIQVGQQQIDYLAIPLRRAPVPVAPAWMIRDKKLYVAAFPQALQEIALAPAGGASLAERQDFTKALARLGGRPSVVVFCDADELIRQLYPFAAVGWTTLANVLHAEEGVAFKPAMLPPLSGITEMLTPGITTVRGEDDGVVIEQLGSLPTLGLPAAPAYVPLGLGAGVPLMKIARLDAKKTHVLTQLRLIAMGCFQYATEHNGRFPGDLAELVVKDYIEPKTLRSPFNDAPPPRLVDGKLVGESDYALAMPGMRMDRIRRTADMPLVMEKIDEDEYDPKRGAGVAFADGHAEWVTGDAERLRKRIQSALQLGK